MNTTTTTSPAESAERHRLRLVENAVMRVEKAWSRTAGPNGLKAALPALNENLEAAKSKLDDTWVDALAGRATIEQFKDALRAWEEANRTVATALRAVR